LWPIGDMEVRIKHIQFHIIYNRKLHMYV
jgi:hypothetical protein